jgi:hypothetical protein
MVFTLSSAFFLLFFLSTSCKKRESEVGRGMLNSNELLNSIQTDTFSLTTFSIEEDSVVSDNPLYAMLGSYNDPEFGTVNSNFYTQLRLSGFNPNFGNLSQLVVDSVVLGLAYAAGYYGDLTSQNVEVYEITESLDNNDAYYSFTTKTTTGLNLVESGFGTFVPNPFGIKIVGKDTLHPELRIKLKNSFGLKFIQDASGGGTDFSSNENFLTYFKGLHVRVNNGSQVSDKGGIFYFNMNHPQSKLTIYYSLSGAPKTFDLLINNACADFNHVEVNNTGKPVQNVLENATMGQKEFYAQALKSRAVVKIPGVKKIPANAIINKANLILPIQYQTGGKYSPPKELSVAENVDGKLTSIGITGFYNEVLKQYTLDLRGHVQDIVNGNVINDEFIVSPKMFNTSAERVIFNGPNSINKQKPKLVVIYTTF